MIVLLLIMIWVSMICNLWLLFRVNMIDEDIDNIHKQRDEDIKGINDNVDVLAKHLRLRVKHGKQ